MSSLDVAIWQAYDKQFPVGHYFTNYLIAQLTAVVFNMWKGQNTLAISPDDVLGIFVPLEEDKVTAVLRSWKGGTN